jgi:glycosyltransferase involved in cell wall biosynthesis
MTDDAGINASIVGEHPTGLGIYSIKLVQELDSPGGGGRCRLDGRTLPNPLEMHPVLDLYIAALRKEGLLLSLVEAMAPHPPVVAADVPGHRDVVVCGETGTFVPPGDTAARANAIAVLISDPTRCNTIGEAVRRRTYRKFAARSMVQATANVYGQAARR